jgi:intron-binding protein aquarius
MAGRCPLQSQEGTTRHIDLRDTIIDADHLKEAFPDMTLQFDGGDPTSAVVPQPPFRVTFPPFNPDKPSLPLPAGVLEPPENTLIVQSYTPVKSTPFPQLQPGQNSVRFNGAQLQVIVAGLQPGLTMCVGPPGTGKTDTAVQV